MPVTFEVSGKVLGKPRPRVNRDGRVWTPAKFRAHESRIAEAYRDAGGTLYDGPVVVCIRIERQLPKTRPKSMPSEPDTYRPDVDNVAKIVLDALNGVAYHDDAQVTGLVVTKRPRTRRGERMVVSVGKV